MTIIPRPELRIAVYISLTCVDRRAFDIAVGGGDARLGVYGIDSDFISTIPQDRVF
jgi:hypothetical protein